MEYELELEKSRLCTKNNNKFIIFDKMDLYK